MLHVPRLVLNLSAYRAKAAASRATKAPMAGPTREPLFGVVVAGASLSVVVDPDPDPPVGDAVLLAEVVVFAWLEIMVVLVKPVMLDDRESVPVVWAASDPVCEVVCDETETAIELVIELELMPPMPPTFPEPLEPELELGEELPVGEEEAEEAEEAELLHRFLMTLGASSRALV